MRKRFAVGLAVAAVYVVVASIGARIGAPPVRPIFDGLAPPQPYRWVSPPPDFAQTNQTPDSFVTNIDNGPKTTKAASVGTSDGQAQLIAPDGSFGLKNGRGVYVEITPLDPARVGAPPPGLQYQGNAYRIVVHYDSDRSPAAPRKPVTVLLRYPSHGTALLLRVDGSWAKLKMRSLMTTLQVFTNTTRLGTFVIAAPGVNRAGLWWAVGVASGLAAMFGTVMGIRERRRLGSRKR